ncbi:hypothetical protein TRIP_B310009 [uncultured Desulfatiglans sp.]|uniref:Uncharacterized protein n=1 Tax=Uncultured Desulfatiglans sp. TaxID=1748965 RepID=A0A653A6H0_UNCDX|nr:hypothetical protein TRIP_B310009 [uncultured Desulfatiglans sp.]
MHLSGSRRYEVPEYGLSCDPGLCSEGFFFEGRDYLYMLLLLREADEVPGFDVFRGRFRCTAG